MSKVYIFYGKYYDLDTQKTTIGGVQTYIQNICEILCELNLACTVVQMGEYDARGGYGNAEIVQLRVDRFNRFESAVRRSLLSEMDLENDLFIFATDTIIFKKLIFRHSIAIQHGVFWDIPKEKNKQPLHVLLSKAKRAYLNIYALRRVSKVICVDYNFVNWIKTQIDYSVNHFRIIPNFSEIAPPIVKESGTVKLIFARRFYSYRGTRIFTAAIARLLDEGEQISVTLAGRGPDERLMRERLASYPNVRFITYESSESLTIHADQHIAVIPTTGSEGTSLSLLEAMSAQCAVICTNVGGMTNIVIDGFNGLMISPAVDELYEAIKTLVHNGQLRKRLAQNAYLTVKEGFSHEKWKVKWIKELNDSLPSLDCEKET